MGKCLQKNPNQHIIDNSPIQIQTTQEPPYEVTQPGDKEGILTETQPSEFEEDGVDQPGKSILYLLGEHFVFNFVNTVQILPTMLPSITSGTPVIFPATVFLESRQVAPWRMVRGNISFLIVLAFLAAGISYNVRPDFLAGIFPLFFFLAYSAGTAVALTSASRYTQPIEWVILLYFCTGLVVFIQFISKPFNDVLNGFEPQFEKEPTIHVKPSRDIHFPVKSFAPMLLLFLVIGSMIPFTDTIFPQKYQIQSKQEILERIDVERLSNNAGMTPAAYLNYVNLPTTSVIEGRLIYAQYYRAGEGEDISRMRSVVYDYPRITFELIGPYKPSMNILLPYEEPWPDVYLNGKTAIVVGCSAGGGIDAVSVILPEEDLYLTRTAGVEQDCQ